MNKFTHDPASIFEKMITFIQESGIVTAMAGLLNARAAQNCMSAATFSILRVSFQKDIRKTLQKDGEKRLGSDMNCLNTTGIITVQSDTSLFYE